MQPSELILLSHLPLCRLQLNQNLCREYHVRGFRIQSTDIGDTPPRLRMFHQKLPLLLRVTGVTVRQGGPNVVLDLDVTYNGEAYLGVSVMKVRGAP